MKFRIIATLVLFVVLGLVYLVTESNQPKQPSSDQQTDGIVLK